MICLKQSVKQTLRKQIIHKIKNLTNSQKKAIELKMYKHLFNSFLWNDAKVIGITSSTSIEWNTAPIIERAWEEMKIVSVPKTISEKKTLKFYRINSFKELKKGYGNILEPYDNKSNYIEKNNIDLLIVPGVVFDQFGYRIGYGGGYYDRFLVDFPNYTVSLVSRLQLVDSLPVEAHDIPVQHLITEEGLRKVSEV